MVRNLNSPSFSWDTGKTEALERKIIIGASQKLFNNFITLVEDINLTNSELSIGCNINLHKTLDLRAGLKDGHLHAGLGLHLYRLTLDYAYVDHSELGASSMVGLSFR